MIFRSQRYLRCIQNVFYTFKSFHAHFMDHISPQKIYYFYKYFLFNLKIIPSCETSDPMTTFVDTLRKHPIIKQQYTEPLSRAEVIFHISLFAQRYFNISLFQAYLGLSYQKMNPFSQTDCLCRVQKQQMNRYLA